MFKLGMFLAFLAATPVYAADKVPPKAYTCGKTIDDCEKVYLQDQQSITLLNKYVQGLTQQRNQAQNALADSNLQVFLQQK